MREDGTYAIYRIQHYVERSKEWDFSNLDHFGYPDGFSASGECWQRTGEHGSFDIKKAKEGLNWIQKVNRLGSWRNKKRESEGYKTAEGQKFRLVCVITSQTTVVM